VEAEEAERDLVARENERESDLDLDHDEKDDKEEPRSDCQENLSNLRRRSSSSVRLRD